MLLYYIIVFLYNGYIPVEYSSCKTTLHEITSPFLSEFHCKVSGHPVMFSSIQQSLVEL